MKWCWLWVLCACPPHPDDSTVLVSETKRALADRERRLSSFHFVAESSEGEEVARHEFFSRAPNRMRGVLLAPKQQTFSFDGSRLYQLDWEAKKFLVFEIKLPAEKAAYFLHTTFAPFVFEGFRTPLLPRLGVTARKIAHPKGPQAVELSAVSGDVTTVYVVRYPSGDFLSKRVGTSELRVEAEKCDQGLKLCVPTSLTQWQEGKRVGQTTLTQVELGLELPQEGFAPTAPAGWAAESHQVVEE